MIKSYTQSKMTGGDIVCKTSPTHFYSQSKILKLSELYKLEIGKIGHAQLQNKLPFKSPKYFTSSNIPQRIRNVWKSSKTRYIPQTASLACTDASRAKRLKFETKFSLEI